MSGTLNQWYVFNDALDDNVIKKLRRKSGKEWKRGLTEKHEVTDEERVTGKVAIHELNPKIRNCDVIWTSDEWIYNLLWPYMEQANAIAGWRYNIDTAEAMQIVRYRKGEFFNWHQDGWHDHLSVHKHDINPNIHNKVRKLSMTVVLNDSFEGGDFEMISYAKEKPYIYKPFSVTKRGQIIVFPSTEEHRVTPVTKGTRYSAVVWFLGPPMQ